MTHGVPREVRHHADDLAAHRSGAEDAADGILGPCEAELTRGGFIDHHVIGDRRLLVAWRRQTVRDPICAEEASRQRFEPQHLEQAGTDLAVLQRCHPAIRAAIGRGAEIVEEIHGAGRSSDTRQCVNFGAQRRRLAITQWHLDGEQLVFVEAQSLLHSEKGLPVDGPGRHGQAYQDGELDDHQQLPQGARAAGRGLAARQNGGGPIAR